MTDAGPQTRHVWHAMPVDRVETEIGTAESGLAVQEARARLARLGPNELADAQPIRPWRILAAQFASLIVWLLIIAAGVSLALGELVDGIAILAIVLLNAGIGFYQEYGAERALAALRRMTAPKARIRRGGKVMLVPARDVVAGDILLVEAGDVVAADARVRSASSLAAIESALTGESLPVEKAADRQVAVEAPLGDRSTMLFMGTAVSRGTGEAIVVSTGMGTEIGSIAMLMGQAGTDTQTPLQRKLDAFGRILVWASLAIVVALFAIGWVRGEPFFALLLSAVSLAVAAVPEGLPAVVTVALALGVQRMARRRALIRRLPAVETLGATTVICTDKTGTLTMNQMTVRAVVDAGGREFAITGEGYGPEGTIAGPAGDPLVAAVLRVAAGCNNAVLTDASGAWDVVGDPTEGALLTLAAKGGVRRDGLERTQPRARVLPFDSDRKLMTVVRRDQDGSSTALVKGAPDVLLARCTHWLSEDGERELTEVDRARIAAANAGMAARALRVLAAARRSVSDDVPDAAIEQGLTFLGLYGMQDPPRAEARTAVARCRSAGIRVVMITGDHPGTAIAIARDLGIAGAEDKALSGRDLDAMDEVQLAEAAPRTAVYARVTAAHKLRIVRAWKSRRALVAMTGDGVNDAPAIKGADIGIAMGVSGTEVTKEAADMVVTDDNFASIVAAVEEGRGIYDNIRKTIQYLLAGNAGELMFMAACIAFALPIPLEPIHLLWINLVTDGLPALCLATDTIDEDVMRRPPRAPDARIADWPFMRRVLLIGALNATVAMAVFMHALQHGTVEEARTHAFGAIVFMEVLRAFGARSDHRPVWELGLWTNAKLAIVVVATFLFQVTTHHFEWLSGIFSATMVSWTECVVLILLGAIPLVVLELGKVAMRIADRGNRVGDGGS